MELLTPYLICAALLAALYFLMRLSVGLSNLLARRAIYKSGVYTRKTTYAALFAQFGAKKLLSYINLPRKAHGGTRYERYEHILILSGAVAVVSLHVEDGAIYNPPDEETWRMRRHSKAGVQREFEFENPVIVSRQRAQAITDLFSHTGVDFRVPVEPICIFLSRQAKFTMARDRVMYTPPEAIRKLIELDEKALLSDGQRKLLTDTLRRYARSDRYAAAKNADTRPN